MKYQFDFMPVARNMLNMYLVSYQIKNLTFGDKNMADTKETKNSGIHLPCGNLEEMLRLMRECREKGNIDCEIIMKEFMGKEFKNFDYNHIKKQFFGQDSKKFNFDEKNKDI